MQIVGRAVLVAAVLEKVLLVDIAQRQVDRDGWTQRLGHELADLERRPAGRLLGTLEALGIPSDLAGRIQGVIDRRNRLVHHLMEDADVLLAMTGVNPQPVIERIDQLAADCQALINDIAPGAFAGVEGAFGATLPDLLREVRGLDLDGPGDETLPEDVRQQLRALREAIHVDDLVSLLHPPTE